jgi:hypothetical protein
MTKWTLQQGALVALILLHCCGTQAQMLTDADAARKKALQDGWPDTPVGLMASAWIEAFSSDEETMRAAGAS